MGNGQRVRPVTVQTDRIDPRGYFRAGFGDDRPGLHHLYQPGPLHSVARSRLLSIGLQNTVQYPANGKLVALAAIPDCIGLHVMS